MDYLAPDVRTGGTASPSGPARRGLAAALAATLLAACGSGDGGSGAGPAGATSDVVQVSGASRAEPRQGAPVDATVAGLTRFAAKLYRSATSPERNAVLSPLSIAYAFAMARAGAGGDTAAALDETFGFPPGVAEAFNALTNGMVTATALPRAGAAPAPSPGEEPQPQPPVLAIANGLFTQRGYEIAEAFLRTLTEQYGSEVRTVDFGRPEDALTAVNAWADEHTAGRIPKILDGLDPMTRLVLANAVYLKASWTEPFTPAGEQPFTVAGSKVDVAMINRTLVAGYATGDGWTAVTIPYFGGRLAMRVLVPTGGGKTPADLLTPEVLDAAGRAGTKEVDLTMPGWDFGSTLDLRAVLTGMGLTLPFDEARADFSRITTQEQLFIDQAVHKANITVDEYGTEAAAVTALSMRATSARVDPPVELTVDRPFAFAVIDTTTGAPLFLGHVADPREH